MDRNEMCHRVATAVREDLNGPAADRETLSGTAPIVAATPFFPDGCPTVEPVGWAASEVDYDGPHLTTVCPDCLPSWQADHLVGPPFTVPDNAPLTFTLLNDGPGSGQPTGQQPVEPPIGPGRAARSQTADLSSRTPAHAQGG